MNGIFRYKNNQPVTWFNRSLASSNQYCLYCGVFIGDGSNIESNKEHLVGREFVPTGAFGKGDLFNFIFRSCKKCNDQKSSVERHISSITLFNSPARASSQTHNDLAEHKAENDYHPRKKGTLVKDSGEKFTISANFGPATLSVGMSVPPQADQKYIELLAFRHIQGLFSLVTSANPLTADGTTLLAQKYFHLYGSYGYTDWGNPDLKEIMNRVQEIPCYLNIETADGFFKAIMRRTKGDAGEWFWALEWNKSLRVLGAIAQQNNTPIIFENLPHTDWKDPVDRTGKTTRIRKESPLDPGSDILFSAEVEGAERT